MDRGVVIGLATGTFATYSLGRSLGYISGWYGPELPSWSSTIWNRDAQQVIDELSRDPSYFCSLNMKNSSGRRTMLIQFYSTIQRMARGVVKYGSDCEGPPRCVHGGCTVATANQIATEFVSRYLNVPSPASLNLDVDYLIKIPLGSQLEFDCCLADTAYSEDSISTKVRFFSIEDKSKVYAKATVSFRNNIQKSSL